MIKVAMSNLSITTRCNKQCPYCFAGDSRSEKATFGDMSRNTFHEALKYLKRSGIGQVRLLGGEPTLHGDFIWMLDQALLQDFTVMIFSNGLMSSEVLDYLVSIPTEKIRVLLNTIHPLETNPRGIKQQRKTMAALGRKAMAGVNIYTRGQDLDYLIDAVKDHDLFPEIRIGIAHPVLSGGNRYLMPKFYAQVGEGIVDLFFKAKQYGIRIGLDCGFVPCMFPTDMAKELKPLFEKSGVCCNPNLDLLPDGRFIACYPLNNMGQFPLTPETTALSLIQAFNEERSIYKDIGIFSHCRSCHLFKNGCHGGCLALKMNRVHTRRTSAHAVP
ncbi:MAG: radical SAM protein [Proteobacteria bacterium]|nr:radical SAM protein [Pseudomonadota bacterium]